ncbi:uncharacterized protein LOC110602232 isoform X2 [Manihot esculenta]|uniref:uncharacterized protein LOC110602232 isoform X2 n=1 Tax=Manihot esculenta TaxID=3983 RepID=UPI000B5D8B4D|nr:uncharacterized protein LOC110602232 isoform X2 [Manihot esculenta]
MEITDEHAVAVSRIEEEECGERCRSVAFRRINVILKDPEAALRPSILFCFNPDYIFLFINIFREFAFSIHLGGLYYLISAASNIAVLWFVLSGCARSNGGLVLVISFCRQCIAFKSMCCRKS